MGSTFGRGAHTSVLFKISAKHLSFLYGSTRPAGGRGGGGYFVLSMRVGEAKKLNWTHHLFDDGLRFESTEWPFALQLYGGFSLNHNQIRG